MCIVKTPKVVAGSEKPPEPTIIRNSYLDGLDPVSKALRKGRSSLRIERAGRGAATAPPATAFPTPSNAPALPPMQPALPRITPVRGGGGGGRIVRTPSLV